jgi:predicted transcriptional regulator of viral defense system
MSQEHLTASVMGIELIRRLAAEGVRIFTTGEARKAAPQVGISPAYVRQALHYLAKAGWVTRLHNGLYAVCSAMPGIAPVHEFEIAMALVRPAAISHWSALHYHGLTEQAPRQVFVLTTTDASTPRPGRAKTKSPAEGYPAGGAFFRFVQTRPDRFFGIQKVWLGDVRISITDPERSLLDGLSMPQYCGDFAEVMHAFEVRGEQLDLDRIMEYALKLDAATVKRLGWVLEQQGVAPDRLRELQQLPIKGFRTLDPSGPRLGPCNRRWMIQENLPGKITR